MFTTGLVHNKDVSGVVHVDGDAHIHDVVHAKGVVHNDSVHCCSSPGVNIYLKI